MKLYTLGTGSCTANPTRYNCSSLLKTEHGLYLFDAGSPCDSLISRAGLKFRDIRAIFITHMHLDHIGGLPNLMRAVSMDSGRNFSSPVTIFLPESSGYEAIRHWLHCTHADINYEWFDFKFLPPKEDYIYEDNAVSIRAFPTEHITHPTPITYAYGIYSYSGNILVTGDLCSDLHDMPVSIFHEKYDVCLCEATHYDPNLANTIFQNFLCGRLILTHVHTPWQSEEGKAKLLSAFRSLPYPVEVSCDGAEYII